MRSSFAMFAAILILAFGVNSVDAGIKVSNPFKKDKKVEDSASVTNQAKSLEQSDANVASQQKPNALRGAKKLFGRLVDKVSDTAVSLGNRQQERYGEQKLEKVADAKSDDKPAAPAKVTESPKDKKTNVERYGDNQLTRAADARDAKKAKDKAEREAKNK